MVGENRAATTARISSMLIPQLTRPVYVDVGKAIKDGIDMYYKTRGAQEKYNEQERIKGLEQNLADAVESGDETAINNAYAKLNPTGYVDYLNRIKANREASDLEFARKKELLDIQNQNAMGLARLKDALGGTPTSAARNYEYLKGIGLNNDDAMAIAFGGNTEAVGGALASGTLGGKGIKSYDTTMGKALAEKESARQDFETLKPGVFDAISRAEKALDDGTGIGAIQGRLGDVGISSEKGAMNQADIKAANAQMNAILRQKLAATGLTGSELNSALEAQAYRYTIEPSMQPAFIRQQIQNFKNDYLSNKKLDISDPRIAKAKAAGYSDKEIEDFLRGK